MNFHLPPGAPLPISEFPYAIPRQTAPISNAENFSREEWSLGDCARALYRRRSLLFLSACLGIAAAGLISLLQPRLYQSQAAIEIQGINDNFLNLRDIYPTTGGGVPSDTTYIQTQVEILQDRDLIDRAIKKLQIERENSGELSRGVVNTLKDNVQILPSRTSRVIRVAAAARDPKLAADMANALTETFIQQSIETRQRTAQQTLQSLNGQLEDLRAKLVRSEAALAGYGRASMTRPLYALRRQVDDDRRFYEAMVQKSNEAAIAAVVPQSNFRLISAAEPSTHPFKPNWPLNLTIGLVGGLLLAVAWVMLREQTNSALRTPGEAGAYLTLPELGAIPNADATGFTPWRLIGLGRSQPERGAIERYPDLSESFRATLASILATRRNGNAPHLLVVTSSQPMEGKTTVVGNLGIALAEISNKVLLLDGDMRRPQLHKVFNQTNSWGLSDLLLEKNAIEDLPLDALVKKTAVPHLHLLPSGACTENIFGLLCSGRMARLIERFRQEFDYVLIDAPPCLEFADARILARYAEELLLVVRANHTDKRMAQAAAQRLMLDGSPVMGVILNRWDPSGGDFYGYSASYNSGNQDLA